MSEKNLQSILDAQLGYQVQRHGGVPGVVAVMVMPVVAMVVMSVMTVVVMPMVMTMAAMHEKMHQRTGQQQQVRQCADDVSQVFSQKEIACNCTNQES